MANKYPIKTLSDILALTPDQRARFTVDLLVWCDFADQVKALKISGVTFLDQFTWVDDARAGEISGVKFEDPDGNVIGGLDFPAGDA